MKNTTLTNEKVIDKIEEMCRVLRTNFQSYAIEMHRKYMDRGENVEYHQKRIEELSMGDGVDDFTFTKGKKYAKIIHHSSAGQKSAHAFVDMNTGDVYKSASWNAPAKGVRYNLLDDQSCSEMYKRADWAGGYLYAK